MSLTRRFLKSLGLEEDKVDSIIEAHTETVDAIKADLTKAKADAEKLSEVQKELDALKGGEDYKAKFEAAEKALRDYKAEIAGKETLAKVKTAYRKLLTEAKVSESAIESVLAATDFSKMKLGEDGALQDAEQLNTEIKSKWGGFITTTEIKGAPVKTPPKPDPDGANPRAAERAKQFYESRYGKATEQSDKE